MLRIPLKASGDAGHNLDFRELGGNMDIRQVAEQFLIEGNLEQVKPYGNGHINDTYLVTTKKWGRRKAIYFTEN